jgi:hypothetical protein
MVPSQICFHQVNQAIDAIVYAVCLMLLIVIRLCCLNKKICFDFFTETTMSIEIENLFSTHLKLLGLAEETSIVPYV